MVMVVFVAMVIALGKDIVMANHVDQRYREITRNKNDFVTLFKHVRRGICK